MGIHDVELTSTFAIPFLYNPDTPLLVTPGFAVHYWNGPTGPPDNPINMPPRVYDAFLDTAWNPRINEVLGGELNFRIGVYSDFEEVVVESLRYQGTALVVMGLSPTVQLKAGATYLDRQRIKILPAGGVVWTPNPDTRFEILFPNPRLAMRLTAIGNTDLWGYLRGEYGGGSWTIVDPADPANQGPFERDYNDMRAAVGLEFERLSGLHGLIEAGVAFDREIYGEWAGGPAGKLVDLNPTVFLHTSLAY
jgi:hypothetical protein